MTGNKVFVLHGIRAKDLGIGTMGDITLNLKSKGVDAVMLTYGYTLLPISNKKAVNAVSKVLITMQDYPGDITLVGYSNGAYTAVQLAEMGYKVDRLVLISPALHKNKEFPSHIKSVDIFHSDEDIVLRIAKWKRWLTRILPWRWFNPHGWGEAGRVGYQGNDPRVTNHDMGDVQHAFYDHTAVENKIVETIEERIKENDTTKN